MYRNVFIKKIVAVHFNIYIPVALTIHFVMFNTPLCQISAGKLEHLCFVIQKHGYN